MLRDCCTRTRERPLSSLNQSSLASFERRRSAVVDNAQLCYIPDGLDLKNRLSVCRARSGLARGAFEAQAPPPEPWGRPTRRAASQAAYPTWSGCRWTRWVPGSDDATHVLIISLHKNEEAGPLW